MQTALCRVQFALCRVQFANWPVQTALCRVQFALWVFLIPLPKSENRLFLLAPACFFVAVVRVPLGVRMLARGRARVLFVCLFVA